MPHHPTHRVLSMSVLAAIALAAMIPATVLGRGPGADAGACTGACLADQGGVQRPVRAISAAGRRGQPQPRAASGGTAGLRARTANRSAGGSQRASRAQLQLDRQACEACQLEKGTLTDDQEATLRFMANEEKLAHDVYTALHRSYDLPIFETIAASETRHLAAVANLMERYGVDGSPHALPEGQFSDTGIAAQYTALVTRGASSVEEAVMVGILIEQDDMEALSDAAEGLEVSAPDVFRVYSNLMRATQRHLSAFEAAA
jgi:hypothetical protein